MFFFPPTVSCLSLSLFFCANLRHDVVHVLGSGDDVQPLLNPLKEQLLRGSRADLQKFCFFNDDDLEMECMKDY